MSVDPSIMAGAETLVRRAAECLQSMQKSIPEPTRKTLLDIVTAADLASEKLIVEGLRSLTPNAGFLAEEQGESGPQDGERWIIDPLDGTVNYASGLPWFSVTLAYQDQGRTQLGLIEAPSVPLSARFVEGQLATVDGVDAKASGVARLGDAVVSVLLTSHFSPADVRRTLAAIERLAAAARGVRIVVSGALELALIASGRLAAFVALNADTVSYAAGIPLVRAAGGKVTRLDGGTAGDADLEKIASNGFIHDELLACIRS